MSAKKRFRTTVHDLMLNFRDALAALTPYMDRAKIPWRDEEAYDDWDDICQAVYRNMVLRTIQFSIGYQDSLTIPEYGTVYPYYGKKSFIEVAESRPQLTEYKGFVGFSTLKCSFDQVRYQRVASDLNAVGETELIPLANATFTFILNREIGERKMLSTLLIEV